VVDDGDMDKPKYDDGMNINYIRNNFDTGASVGRNTALFFSETPYTVCLDDDFVFNGETRLETWFDILENSSIDLVGGNVESTRYEACFDIEDKTLKYSHRSKGEEYGCKLYDIVLQFWMGRTQKILNFEGWDNEFLTADHTPFFLRALNKIKIAHCPKVKVGHKQIRDSNYSNYRCRDHRKLLMKKYGFERIIGYNGEVIVYDNL